jgi:hypothetical protein
MRQSLVDQQAPHQYAGRVSVRIVGRDIFHEWSIVADAAGLAGTRGRPFHARNEWNVQVNLRV